MKIKTLTEWEEKRPVGKGRYESYFVAAEMTAWNLRFVERSSWDLTWAPVNTTYRHLAVVIAKTSLQLATGVFVKLRQVWVGVPRSRDSPR